MKDANEMKSDKLNGFKKHSEESETGEQTEASLSDESLSSVVGAYGWVRPVKDKPERGKSSWGTWMPPGN